MSRRLSQSSDGRTARELARGSRLRRATQGVARRCRFGIESLEPRVLLSGDFECTTADAALFHQAAASGASSRQINVALGIVPSCNEIPDPGFFDVLQNSVMKPADWSFTNPHPTSGVWVTDLSTLTLAELLDYNLVFISNHLPTAFSDTDRDKLEQWVGAGGTVWIDDCGNMSPSNFFQPFGFASYDGWPGDGAKATDLTNHPFFHAICDLTPSEVASLGSSGYSSHLVNYAPDQWTELLHNRSGEQRAPDMLLMAYGKGRVVVTADDYGCAISDAQASPTIKLAYNIVNWAQDTLPPSVKLVDGPAEGQTVGPSGPTFQWTSTDDYTSPDQMLFSWRIDEGAWSDYAYQTTTTLATLTDGPHTFEVLAKDLAGNISFLPARRSFITDAVAPGISDIRTFPPATTHCTIAWTTDEPGTSQIDFGLGDSYGSMSPLDGQLTTQHSVTLSSLQAGAVYHFRVRSADAVGNEAISADSLFITTALPTILGVQPLPNDGGLITGSVSQLTVCTNTSLAGATVNNSNGWELRSAGPDEIFGNGDDAVTALSVSPAYVSGPVITLTGGSALPAGLYRFTAFGSMLKDVSGTALDGNRDGTPGDDFVSTFRIANASFDTRTYTSDADFTQGTFSGTQQTIPGQIQLSQGNPLPYIWVPNQNGTVSKIDIATGNELARYRTIPEGVNSQPSRTTVDLWGNCWVANRYAGTVVKIGLLEANQWIDRNKDGIPQTSRDLNSNGLIDPDELLPFGQDECVLTEVVVIPGREGTFVPGVYAGGYTNDWGTPGPRSLAIDANNTLWVGCYGSQTFYKLDGTTGNILTSFSVAPWGHHAYGAVIDSNGVLWSAGLDDRAVLRIDTNTMAITKINLPQQTYGIALDYLGHLFVNGWGSAVLSKIDITTGAVEWSQSKSEIYEGRGVAVTADNDVWAVSSAGGRVCRYDNEGNLKATISGLNYPTGVAVDANGKVWVCDLNDGFVHRIDPGTNAVDVSKDIPNVGGHYSYSDMTGIISRTITTKMGTWSVVYDSGAPDTPWGRVSWNAFTPAGTGITVNVRASNDQTTWSAWQTVASGTAFPGVAGRYLQIEVTLQITSGTVSPVLYDLIVEEAHAPQAPSNPLPADGAANTIWSPTLNWNTCSATSSYDVYLWRAGQSKPATPTAADLTQTFYKPSQLESGTQYKWQVVAKSWTGQTAGAEWSFGTETLADLEAATVSTSLRRVTAGQDINVTWQVSNRGPAPTFAGTWSDRVYLFSGTTFDPVTATLLQTIQHQGNLFATGQYTGSATVTIPEGISGDYRIAVVTDAFDQVREMIETNNTMQASIHVAPPGKSVLMVNVHGPNYDGDGLSIQQTLLNAGADSEFVNLSSEGDAAKLLKTGSYDQVWVFDLSSWTDSYPADYQAIADWYSAHSTGGIICDGRMISSYWWGRWTGEGQKLTANYFENLKANGGGLVLGTDHSGYVSGINTINSLIGLNPFFGDFDLSYIPVDTASLLMTTPNDMGVQLYDDSSPGQTPYGFQPNGRILYSAAWHSGNYYTPGISTTIEGVIGFHVKITSPEPDAIYYQGQAIRLAADRTGGLPPFTYRWTSSIDGLLGTGPTLDLTSVSVGTHVITLAGADLNNSADQKSVSIKVLSAADLHPLNLTAPAIAAPGQQIDVSFRVENLGSLAATGSWHNAVYLSGDNQPGNDTFITSAMRARDLSPSGDYFDQSVSFTLPPLPAGQYFLIVKADDAGSVYEADRSNNYAVVPIELRLPPKVVSVMPASYTKEPIPLFSLGLSTAVVGEDARKPETYELRNLGPDGLPGTPDDQVIPLLPAYADGAKRVNLIAVSSTQTIDLRKWSVLDYSNGAAGNWVVTPDGQSVTQTINGQTTFLAADSDFIDRQFIGRIRIGNDGDHDLVGLVFGLQTDPGSGKPNNYYVLGWIGPQVSEGSFGSPQNTGFRLIKLTNTAVLAENAVNDILWNGTSGPNSQVLSSNVGSESLGYAYNTDYNFFVNYRSDGYIYVSIRQASNDAVMWAATVTDPSPIGAGKLGFMNYSQSQVTYSGLQQSEQLAEGVYQLTARSGLGGLREPGGLRLDGNGDNQPGDDFVTTFVFDQTPPTVSAAAIAANRITITFSDLAGIDPATATNAANYTLISSGGDGTFTEGNELTVSSRITSVQFDANTNTATLFFAPTVEDEVYQLTINGTAGIKDLAGNLLNGGNDDIRQLTLITSPASVAVALSPDSDSGFSSSDRITHVTAPIFIVTVNKPGTIAVDFNNDGTSDASRIVAVAGSYQFTGAAFTDGPHTVAATLTPPAGSPAQGSVGITIDTHGPRIVPGSPTEQAPLSRRTIHFSESIVPDPAVFSLVTFVGPDGQSIPLTGVDGSGDTHTVAFAHIFAPGQYTITCPVQVVDLAGNFANQNNDDVNGTAGIDDPVDTFTLLADTTKPSITSVTPAGLINQDLSSLTVSFSEAIAPISFAPAAVTITGDAGSVSQSSITVTQISTTQYRVNFPAQSADGLYTILISQAITDLSGNPLSSPFEGLLTIDKTGPYLAGSNPSGTVNAMVDQIVVTFNEPVRADSVSLSDMQLVGPDSLGIPITGVTRISDSVYQVTFPSQRANGTYLFTAGPAILDIAGNSMPQASLAIFTIALPDLAVDPAAAPLTAHHGEAIDVTWTVRNIGPSAAAGNWFDRIWLSRTDRIDTSARLLLTRTADVTTLGPAESYAPTAPVALPADLSLAEGTYYIIAEADAPASGVAESDESNNASVVASVNLTLPPLPDLIVTDIAAPLTADPGSTTSVTWNVRNPGGQTASGTWKTQIYLSSDQTVGGDLLVATVAYTGAVGADPVAQSATVTIPTRGVGLQQWFVIKTNSTGDIFECNLDNNTAIDDQSILIPVKLSITIPADSMTEGAGAMRAIVTRTGSADQAIVVQLASSDTSELVVPPTVTIDAGSYAAAFNITAIADGRADGTQTATVSVSAADATSASKTISVLDADVPSITLILDLPSITEGGEGVQGTVSRDFVTDQPLTVRLAASTPDQINLPATVVIPANEPSATFTITTANDQVPEKELSLTLNATADGHHSDHVSLKVIDDDVPLLQIELPATSMSEAAGPFAMTATIRRVGDTSVPVTVAFTSSDLTEAVVPDRIVIPAGQASADFTIGAVDDSFVDGTQTVTLSAFVVIPACGCNVAPQGQEVAATLDVLDNDGPSLTVAIDKAFVAEGITAAATVTVSRNTDPTDALEVQLLSGDTSELSVPPTVTIPAGRTFVTFTCDTVQDNLTDGNQTVAITASAAGFTDGSARIVVSDVDLPDLVISRIDAPANMLSEKYFNVTYRISNEGLATAIPNNASGDFPGSYQQRIYLSSDPYPGNDLLVSVTDFTGKLPVSLWFERTLPVRAPVKEGDYWIVVATDATNNVSEAVEFNNVRVSPLPVHVQAAYSATVRANIDQAPAGTPVILSGHVSASDTGAPVPFAMINLHLAVGGTTRIIAAVADSNGDYAATFRPLGTEAGHYTVGAAHPGQTSAAVQDEFVLMGMRSEPPQPSLTVREEAAPVDGQLFLRNMSEIPLTGLQMQLIGVPPNMTITLGLGDTGSETTLPGSSTLAVTYRVSASDVSISSALMRLHITSAEGVTLDVPFQVSVEALRARLVASPGSLQAGMLRGTQTVVQFQFTNLGTAGTGDLDVRLPGISWMTLASSQRIASLEPGQSATVILVLTPPADLPFGSYDGSLVVASDTTGLSVPFSFRALSEAKGDLAITTVDEYTYYAPGAPNLAGASVSVRDSLSGQVVASGVTNDAGLFTYTGIPEGYYDITIEATQHATYRSTVLLKPGQVNEIQAFLRRETVQYKWTVVPVEIEDRTKITIETVFETNVPMPVVTVDPTTIDLAPLKHAGQEMQVEITIANHGLIAAQAVNLWFGTDPAFLFMPLVSDLGDLPANSSLTIPVVIRRVLEPSQPLPGSAAAAAAPIANAAGGSACLIPALARWSLTCGPITLGYAVPIVIINPDCFTTHTDTPLPIGPWGPIWGPSGDGGDGGDGPGWTPHWVHEADTSCDPCLFAALKCIISFIPNLPGCILGLSSCVYEITTAVSFDSVLSCVGAVAGCVDNPISTAINIYSCIKDMLTGCTYDGPTDWESGGSVGAFQAAAGGAASAGRSAILENIAEHVRRISTYPNAYEAFFGSSVWVNSEMGTEYGNWMTSFNQSIQSASDAGPRISPAERDALLTMAQPNRVSASQVYTFLDRWNRSIDYYAAGIFKTTDVPEGWSTDFIATDILARRLAAIEEAHQRDVADGYNNPFEGLKADVELLQTENKSGGICARVKLQIDQEAVLTRDGFKATLEVNNGTGGRLEKIGVDVKIFDENGADVTDLFGIEDPTLNGITSVDGNGVISAAATGTSNWIIIPTTDAAKTGPTRYFVGGRFTYNEGGNQITIDLQPTAITVLPQPELDLKYFHERDVLSDDPYTPLVEPAQPFTLAVLVQNNGAGEARNLRIISAQPQIIENEKGLLIDFKIIGTEVAGQNLEPSLTANFGNILPGQIKIARWLLTSTLQGQFIDYKATFQHISPLGDPRLSLIKNVEIHELIHTVRVYGALDDGMPDFLANDLPDKNDLPDTLYLSDGSIASVALAANAHGDGTVSRADREVQLTCDPAGGWTYLLLDDPGMRDYRLARVVRSDGVELPLDNCWQTDRTFIEGGNRPVLENKLHLLDLNSTGQYTLYYVPRDQIAPTILSLQNLGQIPLEAPVSSIDLAFSKDMDAATFDYLDLVLQRDGGDDLITSAVTLKPINAQHYQITGLAPLTATGGHYTLTVNAAGAQDLWGNAGSGSATSQWDKVADVPVVMQITGLPPANTNAPLTFFGVTFSEPINLATLTSSDVTLTRAGSPNLLTDPLSIVQTGNKIYRIGSLDALTAAEGNYVLTINAAGVEDLDGNLGLGSVSARWTMDTTAPSIDALAGVPDGPTGSSLDFFDVVFSEAINPAYFGTSAFTLTRDAGPSLITSDMGITKLAGNRFRIAGLNSITKPQGLYALTVSAAPVRDLASNLGAGEIAVTWSVDTSAPNPATGLAVSPDTGLSSTDGLTSASSLTLTGALAEPGLTVTVFDLTAGRDLGSAAVTGTTFSKSLAFDIAGNHQLRIRATDPAGNYADALKSVFIDKMAPGISGFGGVPDAPIDSPLAGLDITFSEPIDPASFDVSSLSLARNGLPLILTNVVISPLTSLTYHIAGLPQLADFAGDYVLTVDPSKIVDLAGNPGSVPGRASWKALQPDHTPPTVVETILPDRSHVGRIQIRFSEPLSLTPTIVDGSIAQAVSLARLRTGYAPQIIPLAASQFAYDNTTCTLTWSLSPGGVEGLPAGRYEFLLDPARFADLAGNTLSGNGRATLPFGLPLFDAAQNIEAAGSDISVDSYSVPAVADWNSDGLVDLIVGEKTVDGGKVRVYLNTGDAANPAYTTFFYAPSQGSDLVVPAVGCLGAFPRPFDWNNDGRKDLLVGQANGSISLFLNTNTDADPRFDAGSFLQAGPSGAKTSINVGARATFDIVDWNNDGSPDLVAGALDGKVRVFLNHGAPGSPDLASPVVVRNGAVDLVVPTGRSSVAVFDLNRDGRKDLILGNTEGQVLCYENRGSDAAPLFNGVIGIRAAGQPIDLPNASRSRPFIADYNNDGTPDILVGSADGAVRLFAGQHNPNTFARQFLAVSAASNAPAGEGALVHFTAQPDDPALNYTWDFGDSSATAATRLVDHAFADDGSYIVSLTVTDDSLEDSATITQTVDIRSLAPTATFTAPRFVSEGSTAVVKFSRAKDPSAADTAAGFRYSFDFNNDGLFEIADRASSSAIVPAIYLDHAYQTRTVRGRIADQDGACTDYTASIRVNNLPPRIARMPNRSGKVNQPLIVNGSFSDPGNETYTASATFGDRTPRQTLALAGKSFVLNHTYAKPGTYLVYVTVTDEHRARAGSRFYVTVGGTQISGFAVNNGDVQRSMVNTLSLAFDGPVTAQPGAFLLTRRDGNNVDLTASRSPDGRTFTFDFAGSSFANGSLVDGVYDFQVVGNHLRDQNNNPLTDNAVFTCHRLYGDFDGDHDVDGTDLAAFRSVYNKPLQPERWFFDFDQDGKVNATDYGQFKRRLGTRFEFSVWEIGNGPGDL